MKHVRLQGWESTGTIKPHEQTTRRENEVLGHPTQPPSPVPSDLKRSLLGTNSSLFLGVTPELVSGGFSCARTRGSLQGPSQKEAGAIKTLASKMCHLALRVPGCPIPWGRCRQHQGLEPHLCTTARPASPKNENSTVTPEERQQAGVQPGLLHFRGLYSHTLQKGFGCQPPVGRFCLECGLMSLMIF